MQDLDGWIAQLQQTQSSTPISGDLGGTKRSRDDVAKIGDGRHGVAACDAVAVAVRALSVSDDRDALEEYCEKVRRDSKSCRFVIPFTS